MQLSAQKYNYQTSQSISQSINQSINHFSFIHSFIHFLCRQTLPEIQEKSTFCSSWQEDFSTFQTYSCYIA